MKNESITLKKSHFYIIIAAIIVLVVGAIIFGMNYGRWFGADTTNPNIDPNAKDWVGEQLPGDGESGDGEQIKIPGYPSITLPADTQTVAVALLNPEGNPCYFIFELILEDTNESIYTSKLVPPGKAIYQIDLARPLEAGEYAATIKISTYSLEDGITQMNGANSTTTLIVKQN